MTFNFSVLKKKQRKERETYGSIIGLRIHRAISWIKAAEQAQDEDTKFIHYWIAFNSAYAGDTEDFRLSEKEQHRGFFRTLTESDADSLLYAAIWQSYPQAIRVLLENQYVFEPFWDYKRGLISEEDWLNRFYKSKNWALTALSKKNTEAVLVVIFHRLYTLRNQLIHGGATWNSSVNREQLRDGLNILKTIVPLVVLIIMDNHRKDWGSVRYPVLD